MKHLFVLLMLVMIAVPASAATYEITAEPLGGTINIGPSHVTDYTIDVSKLQRNAIQRIGIDIPTGTSLTYTIWYGNGSVLTGHMTYNPAPGMCSDTALVGSGWCQFSEVAIGSSTANHYYVGAQEIGRIDIIGYGRDTTDPVAPVRGFLIYDSSFGVSNVGVTERITNTLSGGKISSDAIAFQAVPSGVIYKFQIQSNKPVTGIAYYTNTKANVETASNTSLLDILDKIWQVLNQIKDTVIDVFWFGYYLFEFIWDNLFLIVPLYFALTGVMALQQSRYEIFKAITTWFRFQRSLLTFILGLIDTLIGLLSKFIK